MLGCEVYLRILPGFVFREQPTDDYGIDAIVEERGEKYLSGKLIGVKVKSGESYFSNANNGRVRYYIRCNVYDDM